MFKLSCEALFNFYSVFATSLIGGKFNVTFALYCSVCCVCEITLLYGLNSLQGMLPGC